MPKKAAAHFSVAQSEIGSPLMSSKPRPWINSARSVCSCGPRLGRGKSSAQSTAGPPPRAYNPASGEATPCKNSWAQLVGICKPLYEEARWTANGREAWRLAPKRHQQTVTARPAGLARASTPTPAATQPFRDRTMPLDDLAAAAIPARYPWYLRLWPSWRRDHAAHSASPASHLFATAPRDFDRFARDRRSTARGAAAR